MLRRLLFRLPRAADLLLLPVTALLLSGTTASAADDESFPKRPNLLFLLADDLGYEMLGSYGGTGANTPRLDRLAAEGMRFTRAYGSPACTPTRISLYSGIYPTNHGVDKVLPVHRGTRKAIDFVDRFPTYAQTLRTAGYHTVTTGKWQLATLEHHPDHIRTAGFDSWCVWQIWRNGAKTTRYWQPTFNHNGTIRRDIADRFGPDVLADYVIGEMRTAVKRGQPFCIQHNMLLPHVPIVETPAEKTSGDKASLRGMITYMDHLVGRISDAVDELGIAEETCLVFLGDNGTEVAGGIRRRTEAGPITGGKRSHNDGGTHLPLIVRWPGTVTAGSTADDLVDAADFFPTFCELARVEVPGGSAPDGISFASRLLRGEATGREVTVAAYQNYSAFDGKWRLVSDGTVLDARHLPAEKKVAPEDADPAAMERLREVLKDKMKE